MIDFNGDRFRFDAIPEGEVMRAKRFEVIDDEGRIRGTFGTTAAGMTAISIHDIDGNLAFGAGVSSEGPLLILQGRDGSRVSTAVTNDFVAVTVSVDDGETRIQIGIKNGQPVIEINRSGSQTFVTERGVV